MATNPAPSPTVEKVDKTYSYFDGTTLESKSETVSVEFTPPTSLADAMARIDNDQSVILAALTSHLRRAVLKEAKKAVLSKGVSKKIVLGVLRPFRALPPWATMYEIGPDGKPKQDKDGKPILDRAAQTKALLEMLRSNPAILEAIKAANAADDSDDDGDEGDE